jgi:hypothetical protein
MSQIVQILRGPSYDDDGDIYSECLILNEEGYLEEDRIYYDTMGEAIEDLLDIQVGPLDMEEEWFDPEEEYDDDQ